MTDEQKVVFRERLIGLMKKKGHTPQTLARRIGSPDKTIRNYVNGKSTPTPMFLKALAQVLCVSEGYLKGEEE